MQSWCKTCSGLKIFKQAGDTKCVYIFQNYRHILKKIIQANMADLKVY